MVWGWDVEKKIRERDNFAFVLFAGKRKKKKRTTNPLCEGSASNAASRKDIL